MGRRINHDRCVGGSGIPLAERSRNRMDVGFDRARGLPADWRALGSAAYGFREQAQMVCERGELVCATVIDPALVGRESVAIPLRGRGALDCRWNKSSRAVARNETGRARSVDTEDFTESSSPATGGASLIVREIGGSGPGR